MFGKIMPWLEIVNIIELVCDTWSRLQASVDKMCLLERKNDTMLYFAHHVPQRTRTATPAWPLETAAFCINPASSPSPAI